MSISVSGTLVASQLFLRPLPTSEFQCVTERVATFLGVSMLISLPPPPRPSRFHTTSPPSPRPSRLHPTSPPSPRPSRLHPTSPPRPRPSRFHPISSSFKSTPQLSPCNLIFHQPLLIILLIHHNFA